MLKEFYNVRTILLVLLIAVLLISVLGLIIVVKIQNDRADDFTLELKSQHEKSIEEMLQISTIELQDLIYYEYAQWDETVYYVKSPNKQFVEVNIDWLVEDYKFDGIWILNLNKETLYANKSNNIKSIPLAEDKIEKIFRDEREIFFYTYIDNHAVEVYGSTIHFSGDNYKKGSPFGYFIAARVWSDSMISKFQILSNSEIIILPPGVDKISKPEMNKGILKFTKEIFAWDKKPAAILEITIKSKILESYHDSFNMILALFIVTYFIVVSLFGIVLKKAVSNPLTRINESLDVGNSEGIKTLTLKNNEFGKIAKSIDTFFSQKDALNLLIRNKNQIEEEERKRISRELHDSIGQMLMSIRLNLTSLGQTYKLSDKKFFNIKEGLIDVANELNRIIHSLHPVDLERYGLVNSITILIKDASEAIGFQVDFKTSEYISRLPFEIELAIYRIIQESISNIIQHSKASEASVEINEYNSHITLLISDNGIGFEKNLNYGDQDERIGKGLINIKYRTEIFGGSFDIDSKYNSGTKIKITIPINKHENKNNNS